MKVAIVHDWLTSFGGAERVVLELLQIFPNADLYTLVYRRETMDQYFGKYTVRTTFIQKMPGGVKHYRAFLPLMPAAFEDLDMRSYDLVLSSSSSCAKGVITRPDAIHICYCHTPMRYAWDMYGEYVSAKSFWKRTLIAVLMKNIRLWDRVSADRVNYFVSNSNYVAKRIKAHYQKEAKTIYPPVLTDFYQPSDVAPDNYYLIVSRLVSYKKVDLAVQVFNQLSLPLIIVGSGPEEKRLKKLAFSNITFKGNLSDEEIRLLYQRCRALVFGADEDFGIVPVEVQACGRPVIAYKKGGVLETVVDQKTGILYSEQTVDSLKSAVLQMENEWQSFQETEIRKNAEKFSASRFRQEIVSFLEVKMGERIGKSGILTEK